MINSDFSNINNMLFFVANPQNHTEQAQVNKLKWSYIWYGVLSNILMGIFSYENIPNQLIRRIEKSFFSSSFVVAYEEKGTGVVVAPASPMGDINAWGEYSAYDIILPNGEHRQIQLKDCVVGSNFYMPTLADSVICWQYAQQIAELKISIDNAIILSRNTALLEVPNENCVEDVLTQYNKHETGVPVIVKKRTEEESYKVQEFTSPTKIDDYYNGLRDIINEFLTTTGLSSLVNPNKKERLIVDEVSSNDDIKNTLLSNRIENRKSFIDEINAKFGTDYKVSIDENIYSAVSDLANMNSSEEVKEGEE